tara:strand:+ start:197 stop:892 length:696 start_codon:yes stop_codon:yes gene_type:complete
MKYSLIIPCYNEEKNLPLLLDKCKNILLKNDIELVIVNNGSLDKSSEVLLNLKTKYKKFKIVNVSLNKGYGYGILSGIMESSGEIIAWTHADLQTDPNDIIKGFKFFDKFGQNIFVKGLRYGRPLLDNIFTFGMSCFETLLLGKFMRDINAQPTIISRNFFKDLSNPPLDFSLDLFIYYHAKKKLLKVYRFPVNFPPRIHGFSNWNVDWSSKIKFILRTIKYSLDLRRRVK